MTIGERIKTLRKNNDLTQEKLADYLCVSYQAVSKWECGASLPDLSLIVPLAKLLHVTTDELLGMVNEEIDEKKREYDVAYEKPHFSEHIELAYEASREYPWELKYKKWIADCLFLKAYDNYTTQENLYKDLEEVLKLQLVVFENSTDDKSKNEVLAGIVQTLSRLHRNDEAVKYAEMYPSSPDLDKDTVMGWALEGNDKEKHLQKVLMRHFDEMISILINKVDPNNPNIKRLDCLECAEKIICTMFPSGEYSYYYEALSDISIYKAQILSYIDSQNAIEELKKAREYAERFDDICMKYSTNISFDSPYFSMINFSSEDLLVYYVPFEENKRVDRFKWWLSGKCFDALRENSEFQKLLDV